ncbi:MAG: acetolactate synthase large subunit [Pseudomonadota bacterium]|nr:acetolactate synthase large subunit [Pseudomonadota bacterium]
MTATRSGARALLDAAYASGIRICFANPGTTELAIVRALEEVPGVRPVLGLFEGVCTGAADGYARVSGRPALTLLHLGPGLANGLANLHNARRAHSPVVNIVGDHATWHLQFDAPLTSDIAGLARPVSEVIQVQSADSIELSMNESIERALNPPGSVVTVIAPDDLMVASVATPTGTMPAAKEQARHQVSSQRLATASSRASESEKLVLLLGADALTERGQRAAERIAAKTGARLIMESYPAIVALGGDLPRIERLAYFPQDVIAQLAGCDVLLAGARAPISYFGYPGQPSELVSPAQRLIELSVAGEDSVSALEQLSELVRDRQQAADPRVPAATPPASRNGTLTPVDVAEELVEQLPEGAIVSLEGSSCGAPYLQRAHRARRHRVMTNTGGAIGQGIPCAVGAAFAQPDARVICLQSDGSAQYTVQALWTMARERLNVTVVMIANHRYGILQTELSRAGARLDQPVIERMTRLDSPRIDWLSLAAGYGVPAARATTVAEFKNTLAHGLQADGPFLIEAQLA